MPVLTLEQLLSPFLFLDIATLYEHYSSIIDFTLTFFLFLGITTTTLPKRFGGRPGKAIAVTVALLLAIGFSLMERQMNISLRTFGPLGAFVLVFMVAIVLLNLLRATGMSNSSSLCLTYIIVYLSLQLLSPNLFDWISENAPFINGILGLAFIISAIKLILSLFRTRTIGNVASKLTDGNPLQSQVEHQLEDEETEKNLVGHRIRRLARKDFKKTRDIIGNLKHITKIIESANTSQAREKISQELKKIGEGEHYILGKLDYIEKLNSKIERHDAASLNRLETQYQTASGKEKDLLKEEIDIEHKKSAPRKTQKHSNKKYSTSPEDSTQTSMPQSTPSHKTIPNKPKTTWKKP